MITTEVRTLSPEYLNKIQNGIEQCLLLHLTLNETKNTLQVKAKVIPEFTEFAWKKLEEANPEFFLAYNFRLLMKDQITKFNRLLERQAELMAQLSGKPITNHMSCGSDIPPQINQKSALNGQDITGSTLQPGDMLPPLPSTLYSRGESSSVPMQRTNDISNDANTASTMLMTQSSNMGLVQRMNGLMQTNSGYLNGSTSMCGLNGNVLDDSHPTNTVSNMLMTQSSNMGLVRGLSGLMQQNSGYLNGSPSMCGLNGNVLDASYPANTASNMLMTQSSNMGLVPGMNGPMQPNSGYLNGSTFMCGLNDNVLDASLTVNTTSNMLMTQSSNMGFVQGMNGLMQPNFGYLNGSTSMCGLNDNVLDSNHPVNTTSNMLMTQSSNMGLVQGMSGLMQPNSGYLNGSTSKCGLNGNVLAVSHPTNTGFNMLMTQNSNMGLVQGLMQPNSGYLNGSSSMFGLNGNVLDANNLADTASNILMTQSSNIGLVQGMNELMQPNSSYLNGSPSMFGRNENVLDANHPTDNASNMLMTQSSNMGLLQGLMQPNSGYLNGSPSMFELNGNVLDASHPTNTASNMLMTQSSNMGLVQGLNGLMQPNSGYLSGSSSMFGLIGNVLDASHPVNTASNMLMTQSSKTGLVQGVNGLIQPESGYLNGSPSMFGHTGNNLDASHPAGDIPVSYNMNETLVRNSEPHFLAAGSDSSVYAQLHVEEQEDLDTISEDLDTISEDLDTIPEGLTSDEDGSD